MAGLPPTAQDTVALPGEPFAAQDFYRAYLAALDQRSQAGNFIHPENREVFNSAGFGLTYDPQFTRAGELFTGNAFSEFGPGEAARPGVNFINPDTQLTHLESEQLKSFESSGGTGVPASRSGFDFLQDVVLPAATAALAIEAGPAAFLEASAASQAGQAIGGAAGGPQGAQIGGIAGSLVGSTVGGLSGGAAPTTGTDLSTTDIGGLAGSGGSATTATSQALSSGVRAGLGSAVGASSAGGGSAPGSTLGTDQSTNVSVGGGATGAASTPGSSSLGTGAPPIGSAQPVSQIAQGVTDVASAARLASSFDSLINPPTQGPLPSTGQAPSQQSTQAPIGGAQSISQIAASAPVAPAIAGVSTGQFQGAVQDFSLQQENAIRARFANQGISESPQEQVAIQNAQQQSTQRATALEQAMVAAGVSDPNVFAALLVSNISPNEFASSLQRLRA